MSTPQTVEYATLCLSGVCDWAVTDDGQGYNKPDACIMNPLARKHKHTSRQRYLMYNILRKYREQLKGFGVQFDMIPKPPRVTYDDILLPFGKYKGYSLLQVYRDDRSYVKWLSTDSYNYEIKEASQAIIQNPPKKVKD